jgi:hypothetical protein
VFTRRANWRRGVDGPIFRGRFHSVRLERDAHLTELLRYIHRNPLDVGWDRPLVDYPWSSHGAHAGRRPAPPWLHTELVRELFGTRSATYLEFVDRADEPVARGVTSDRSTDRSAPAPPPERPTPTTLAQVVDAVAAATGRPAASIRTATPGAPNDARLVALALASTITSAPAAELAASFGFRSAGSVRSALSRSRRLLDSSEDARTLALAATATLGLPDASALLAS